MGEGDGDTGSRPSIIDDRPSKPDNISGRVNQYCLAWGIFLDAAIALERPIGWVRRGGRT